MARLAGMHEERRRAGRRERRRDLAADVTGLAHPGHDEPTLGTLDEIDGGNQLGKVRAVVMDVAGHPDFPIGGQVDDLLIAQRAELVLIAGRAKRLDNMVGAERRHLLEE